MKETETGEILGQKMERTTVKFIKVIIVRSKNLCLLNYHIIYFICLKTEFGKKGYNIILTYETGLCLITKNPPEKPPQTFFCVSYNKILNPYNKYKYNPKLYKL